ncbi:AraC family transcriptional regulator [Paenibacillus pinisoli]|uniref:AraC family transcriptional regulator n=1 Tax=Paenibacillus pinisoli TaxID=1276110 RepID=A0A3A6PCS5_9BACL|nr:AraC family transcriptional regulator [Paenibacillus pinisoli]RJX37516.1 AraC family transcriptional regulator [Paenibacillus pinisoli]
MTLTISCIKINELIAPGHTLQWGQKNDDCAYFESMGNLVVKWGQNSDALESSNIVVGRRFKLVNMSAQVTSVRGVIFRLNPNVPLQKTFILKERSRSSDIYSDITDLFDNVVSPSQLYQSLSILIPMVLTTISNNSSPSHGKEIIGKIDPRLILIHRFIRKNYEQQLSLHQLAELIHCNHIYLSNTYSKVFGISPMRYVQYLRMKKAKELLTASNIPVIEIANQLGYISSSQFSAYFKRYYNLTPSEYRNQQLF